MALALARTATALTVGLALLLATPRAASAAELTLGVFLPNATFATNAERNAWSQRLAAGLTAATEGRVTVTARTFAWRRDVSSFLAAGRVDLLVTDGLLMVGRSGTILAHAAGDPAAALYAPPGTTTLSLKGKTVALAEAGSSDLTFYGQAALAGECDATRFFGDARGAKDAAAALGAVKARAAAAAFAPAGHPAASGLTVLARGGTIPRAVLVLAAPEAVDDSDRDALVAALIGGLGRGGGITGWGRGAGSALDRARALATSPPRALTTAPLLAARAAGGLRPPPLRLQARGALPELEAPAALGVAPTLPEPAL